MHKLLDIGRFAYTIIINLVGFLGIAIFVLLSISVLFFVCDSHILSKVW